MANLTKNSVTPDSDQCPAYNESDRYSIIPATGYVRLPQILKVIPISKSSWWNGVRSGKYPKSLKIGYRTTVWKAEHIHQLIADIAGGE